MDIRLVEKSVQDISQDQREAIQKAVKYMHFASNEELMRMTANKKTFTDEEFDQAFANTAVTVLNATYGLMREMLKDSKAKVNKNKNVNPESDDMEDRMHTVYVYELITQALKVLQDSQMAA